MLKFYEVVQWCPSEHSTLVNPDSCDVLLNKVLDKAIKYLDSDGIHVLP